MTRGIRPAGSVGAALLSVLFFMAGPSAVLAMRAVPQQMPAAWLGDMAFSPDANVIAVAGDGLYLWSSEGVLLRQLTSENIFSVAFLDNGAVLVAAPKQGKTIRFYKVLSGESNGGITVNGGGNVSAMAITRNETELAAGTSEGVIEIWNLKTGKLKHSMRTPSSRVSQLAFLSDGTVVSSSIEPFIEICQNGSCYSRSAQGRVDNAISVWGPDGSLVNTVYRKAMVNFPAFSVIPGSDRIAVINGRNIEILDGALNTLAQGGIPDQNMPSQEPGYILSRPDGKAIILGGSNGSKAAVDEFSYPGFNKLSGFTVDVDPLKVSGMSFSPDSRRLGVIAASEALIVSDGKGSQVARLGGKFDQVPTVAVAPRGGTLASGTPVRLWDWTGAWSSGFQGYVYPGTHELGQIRRDPATGKATLKNGKGVEQLDDLSQIMAAVLTAGPVDAASVKSDSMVFSENGRYLLMNSQRGDIYVMQQDGRVVSNMPAVPGSPVATSRNNKFAFLAPDGESRYSGTVQVMDLITNKKLNAFPSDFPSHSFAAMSEDGGFLAWGNKIWDLSTNSAVSEFYAKVLAVSFKRRLALIKTTHVRPSLCVLGWEDADYGCIPAKDNLNSAPAVFTESGTDVFIGYNDGTIELRSSDGLKLEKRLLGHSGAVISLALSRDGKFLVSAGKDNAVNVWNLSNFNRYTRVSQGEEWAIFTPDGYFDASPRGGKLISLVDGLRAYPLEQAAAEFNRPDLILERMGLGNQEALDYYNFLHQKRMRARGAGAAGAAVADIPEAEITGVKKDGKYVTVNFVLSDKGARLKRCRIYVNHTPLYGPEGRIVTGASYSGSERIELTGGRNKIEVSAVNENGAESLRASVYEDYKSGIGGDLYYLGFGVSKYKDPELALKYADKDARDLESLVRLMGPQYDNVHVKTLLNSEVTADSIKGAREFLLGAKVRDTVILFMAGHGGYDKGKSPKYYFFTYDADPKDPKLTSVDFDTIDGLLAGLQARRKLLLIDTCESGELDEGTFANYYRKALKNGIIPRTARKPVKGRGQAGPAVRDYLLRKDRYIYNDLTRRSGSIVFSSSRGDEMSYESSMISNGFFTQGVLGAFTDKAADKDGNGMISADELQEYVADAVADGTGGLQHPTVDRDNIYQGMELPSLAR